MRAALCVLALAACVEPAPPIEPQVTSHTARMQFLPIVSNKVDILFVIDSSSAIAPHRANLDAQLPLLMDALGPQPFELPDLHIGVITANDDGVMHPRGSMTGTYLSDAPQINGTRTRNYAGTLAQAFGAYAAVGELSTLPVRPFEAVQRALAPTTNPGFSREDASLVVIYIAATDDVSAVEVATHAAELKAHHYDPSRVSVVTISGPRAGPSPCGAGPAPRLHALLDAFPNRNHHVSLCDDDLTPAIGAALLYVRSLQLFCWEREPIVPHDCSAYLSLNVYGEETTTPIGECTTAAPTSPCWRIVNHSVCAQQGSVGLTTQLEPTGTRLPQGTQGWIECVVGAPSGQNP